MFICFIIVFILIGGISIFSLCKAAGRADQLEEEMLGKRDVIERAKKI